MINFAINLANFAISLAQTAIANAVQAYNNAVAWARTQINNAIAWITQQIAIARIVLEVMINIVGAEAKSFAATMFIAAMATINVVSGWVTAQINTLTTWAGVQIAFLRAYIDGQLRILQIALMALINMMIAPFMPLIVDLAVKYASLMQLLNALKALIASFNLPALLAWVDNAKQFINGFMSDPLGFILAFLQEYIWPIVQWEIAYALGTTVYDLPPKPNWGAAFGVGEDGSYQLAPAKNNALVWPLTRLYVSGNRFNPDHRGTDYGLAMGDPVFAIHDGVARPNQCGDQRYGNCIVIDGGEWWSLYAHLQHVLVADGDFIPKGTRIATGDSTGNSTGPHLHIEIRHNGVYINPETNL